MPTTDERREVAARLRHVAEHGAPEWATTACCIAECLGEDNYSLWSGSEKLFDCLADLIEPQEHICLGCINWSAIEGNPVKGVCAEFSDPEDGIERATPYYGFCHEWEGE